MRLLIPFIAGFLIMMLMVQKEKINPWFALPGSSMVDDRRDEIMYFGFNVRNYWNEVDTHKPYGSQVQKVQVENGKVITVWVPK
jgi:hypothetical protein